MWVLVLPYAPQALQSHPLPLRKELTRASYPASAVGYGGRRMLRLALNSDIISKYILGSFLQIVVLRGPGELNCLIIDELVWNLVIIKLLLKCIEELPVTYICFL